MNIPGFLRRLPGSAPIRALLALLAGALAPGAPAAAPLPAPRVEVLDQIVAVKDLCAWPKLALLPDGEIDSFMSRRIKPLALGAAAMMLISFAVSEVSRSVPVDHLYLAPPDSLMLPYWIAHFGTATALGAIACYGVFRLRGDPRAVLLNVLMGALMTAALSGGLVVGWGVITGRIETLRLVAWLLTYAAFAAAAVGSAIQWRHRVRALVQLPD